MLKREIFFDENKIGQSLTTIFVLHSPLITEQIMSQYEKECEYIYFKKKKPFITLL
jgi:hypothetical protein